MSRLVPNPQDLIEQLLRLLPQAASKPRPSGPTTEERILDAALEAFTEHGIQATTMTRIAKAAGISREWLYKQFANRDALVVAVTRREVARFIDGLAVRAFQSDEFEVAVTEAFVYSVEFFRDNELLRRVLTSETQVITPQILDNASPIVSTAVLAGATYLSALGDLDPEQATIVAETLVRLAAAVALAPQGALDLRDPDALRRYAGTVVPATIAGSRAPRPRPPKTATRTRAK